MRLVPPVPNNNKRPDEMTEPMSASPDVQIQSAVPRSRRGFSGNRFVFRQFHVEGFVNEYVELKSAADGKTTVFVSERIENIPECWRARETYKIVNQDEYTEVFELAAPGREFQLYAQSRWKRVYEYDSRSRDATHLFWNRHTPPAIGRRLRKWSKVPCVHLFDSEAAFADKRRNVACHVAAFKYPTKERFRQLLPTSYAQIG